MAYTIGRSGGLRLRGGLHTSGSPLHDGKVTGIAVSIGAQIAGLTGAGEVLVPRPLASGGVG